MAARETTGRDRRDESRDLEATTELGVSVSTAVVPTEGGAIGDLVGLLLAEGEDGGDGRSAESAWVEVCVLVNSLDENPDENVKGHRIGAGTVDSPEKRGGCAL